MFVAAQLLVVFSVFSVDFAYCERKNVLFVVADDLRLSFDKNTRLIIPNIDDFSEKSAVFTNAYAQFALCAPSRNSFLTSRRPDTVRLYDFYSYWRDVAGNFTTLPQYFKESGYETYSIGKVFHEREASNFTDDWPYSWSQPAWHPPSYENENSPLCLSERGWNADIVCPVRLEEQPGKTLPDIESANEAIRFLDSRAQNNNPFFLAVGFHKPHVPLRFPQEYLDFYPLENISLPDIRTKPPKMPDVAWNPFNDARERDDIKSLNVSFPYGPIPDFYAKRIRQAYFSAISYVDSLFGKILTAVKRNNLDNNTVIVFLSDHGWSLGEHGEWAKFSNFDVALRVPLIVKIPGKTNGSAIRNVVELVDVFPTLVDILELPALKACNKSLVEVLCTEGQSLYPLILGQKQPEKPAFSQYPRPGLIPTKNPNSDRPLLEEITYMGYSVLKNQVRYTTWTAWQNFTPDWSKIAAEEMYDHRSDPDENHNLAGNFENIAKMQKTVFKAI